MEDIIRIFHTEVRELASALPPSTPPTTIASSSSSASGPSRMTPEDLLSLSPQQLRSLSASVAPVKISVDVYMKLTPLQMDALPTFISIDESTQAKPTKPKKKNKK